MRTSRHPLIEGFCGACKPADRRPPWQWCEEHVHVDETSPLPGRWRSDASPWVRAVMGDFANNGVRDIAVQCAAQSAKTQTVMNCACWAIAEDPGPAMWVTATKDELRDFLRDRLTPTFETCRPVKERMAEPTLTGFAFDGMPFYAGWSGSKARLQSKPIRWLFCDEVRNYPPGRLEMVLKRTRSFWNSRRFLISTPGTKGDAMDTAYRTGDQRVWYFECPACQHLQPLKFEQLKWDSNDTTKPEGKWRFDALAESMRFECAGCGHRIKDTPVDRRWIENRKGDQALGGDNSAAFRLEWPHLVRHTPATSKKQMPISYQLMYEDLSSLISRLREMVDDDNPQKGYWKILWSLVREISADFKTTRFPTKQEREDAWSRFQELVEEAKARGESNRARIAEQEKNWEKRKQKSDQARSEILVKAHYTRPSTDIEQAIAAPILLPLQIVDAILRKILGMEDLDARKEELLSCSKAMREAWDLFGELKADLLPADKAQIYKTLSDAQERLDAAWADYKAESNRLWRIKQEAWERRQIEREEKHRQFVERVNANVEKLEGNLEKAKEALERHESRLEKVREDYENAWSDSFKERCSGWIDECEEKVRDIQASIERMEGWIDEERAKLR